MKLYLIYLIELVLSYGATAFIKWEYNPNHWEEGARVFVLCVFAFAATLTFVRSIHIDGEE